MNKQVSSWVLPVLPLLIATQLLGCASKPARPLQTQASQPAPTPAQQNAADTASSSSTEGGGSGSLSEDPKPIQEDPEAIRKRTQREKEIHLSLVNKMISQKNEYAALAHLDSYDRRWGASFESKRLRADCLRRTRQLDEAETLYKSILGQQSNARIWYGLGKVSIEKNDMKTAATRLEKAVQVDPLMVEAYSDLGLIYLLEGKQTSSYDTLMKASQLSSNDQGTLANLALWGLVYQDFDMAKGIADRLKWSDKTRTQVLNQANVIRKRIGNPGGSTAGNASSNGEHIQ